MSESDLARQRRAAEALLQMRAECRLSYAPVVIYRANNLLTITAADSLRAAALPVSAIVEIIDMPRSATPATAM